MTATFRGGWRTLLFAIAACVITMGAAGENRCDAPTTLLIARHADRLGSDDALSEAGMERARVLARTVGRSGVTAIYHSDTERTRLTADPLATELGITPVVLPGKDVEGLLQHIFANHCGETVLIVGHSNTVPMIIAAVGGPALADLPEDAFDDLFVLTARDSTATCVNLKYGAPSPLH